MSSQRTLTSEQAREIEEQLFAIHRTQISRHVPAPLPRQDFWEMVRLLLVTLDMEVQTMVRNGTTDMRLQNLQKRQTNIRRIASELARKRMVAMMQHVASQSLRSGGGQGAIQNELPPLEWQRHDPAEKAFYHSIQIQVDRFKKEIDWRGMQQGLAGEGVMNEPRHAPGTVQLQSFQDEQLTPQPPPQLAFEVPENPVDETELDEEDLLFNDPEWADEEAYLFEQPSQYAQQKQEIQSTQHAGQHAAAMELAPSPHQSMIPERLDETSESTESSKINVVPHTMRIRVIQSHDEALLTEDGSEIHLHIGDIHMLDENTATWLVDAGLAEPAEL